MEVVLRIYLAHPFAKKDMVAELQPYIESIGIEVINPFERPEQTTYDRALATTGLTDKMCGDIVRMDLEKIDQADAVVAMLIDDAMVGTVMEVFYAAYVLHKPVFAWAGSDRYRKHPWFRTLTRLHPSWNEMVADLQQYKEKLVG